MGMPYEEICVAALGDNQAAVRQLDHALKEAAKDIADPNSDVTKRRVVTLRVELKPALDRQSAEISYKVEKKFPGDTPGVDFLTISRDGRGHVPMADQMSLPGTRETLRAENGGEE